MVFRWGLASAMATVGWNGASDVRSASACADVQMGMKAGIRSTMEEHTTRKQARSRVGRRSRSAGHATAAAANRPSLLQQRKHIDTGIRNKCQLSPVPSTLSAIGRSSRLRDCPYLRTLPAVRLNWRLSSCHALAKTCKHARKFKDSLQIICTLKGSSSLFHGALNSHHRPRHPPTYPPPRLRLLLQNRCTC